MELKKDCLDILFYLKDKKDVVRKNQRIRALKTK